LTEAEIVDLYFGGVFLFFIDFIYPQFGDILALSLGLIGTKM